jgi:PqqD family protein of HPr-rel-A system
MTSDRYVADPPELLPAVAMEGFAVAYHVPSGITHLLAAPLPEVLAVIAPARGAADLPTIVARLAAEFDLGDDAAAGVAARIAELEAAGLVRRT